MSSIVLLWECLISWARCIQISISCQNWHQLWRKKSNVHIKHFECAVGINTVWKYVYFSLDCYYYYHFVLRVDTWTCSSINREWNYIFRKMSIWNGIRRLFIFKFSTRYWFCFTDLSLFFSLKKFQFSSRLHKSCTAVQ